MNREKPVLRVVTAFCKLKLQLKCRCLLMLQKQRDANLIDVHCAGFCIVL